MAPGNHDDAEHDHAGHDHSLIGPPVSRRLRVVLAAIIVPLVLATATALIVLWPSKGASDALTGPGSLNALANATVTGLDAVKCVGIDEDLGTTNCVDAKATVTSTSDKGRAITFSATGAQRVPTLRRGDKVVLVAINSGANRLYSFYGFQRSRPLALLLVLFVGVAIAIGRWHGARALAALALSLLILVKFVLPAITEGQNPLAVALVGAATVMLVALYLTHGFNARTTTAVIGTLASLAITGGLARVFVTASHFTGLASEEENSLRARGGIDVRGLLLAGIIIGALGVLDDVTVTQASAVWQLHQANPARGFGELYHSAMRIGRDHIASTVNTLVLVYAGAALPLLILFNQNGVRWGEVVTEETIATEVVRTLVGSIGLMASVPITTALTAMLVIADRDEGRRSAPTAPTARRAPRAPREWKAPRGERSFRDGD